METRKTAATVFAGGVETRYTRCGCGITVLVLAGDTINEGIQDELARSCRVYAPEIPQGEPDLTAWLRGVIEGLGIVGAVIVAAKSVSPPALALAGSEPELVRGVYVVPPGSNGAAICAALGPYCSGG